MTEKLSNKIIGYLLLFAGILIIAYSTFNVYGVFKGKSEPFPLFQFEAIALDLSKFVEGAPPDANLSQELIASGLLNDPLNLVSHIILMGFIVTSGFKIASIGVMLVRTIKVNLKEEKESILNPSFNKPGWK